VKWRRGWVALAVTVAACTPVDSRTTRPDTPWYRTVVEPMQSDADRIARFYDRLLTMKGNELAGELETIRGSFEKDKSELNRLQLALLLSFPGTNFRDDNAALALLNPIMKDKGREGSTLRPLAVWLHSELLELRRTDEALQQQTAKLKEEQRRAEALQQKLEAILDMEMKMIEREQNLPKKK
jgi:ATP-dependent exoDNAse (exonuclease V) alpha subunit